MTEILGAVVVLGVLLSFDLYDWWLHSQSEDYERSKERAKDLSQLMSGRQR
jgi:hypothetical protein